MSDPPEPSQSAGGDARLVHQWVVAGIVSAAARFAPLPFVDDIIRGRCRQYVVARTLAAHNRSERFDEAQPLYDASSNGCLPGCMGLIASAPLKVLLFPIRKVITLLTSVRGVPLEIMRVVLLGRTLDRHLRKGDVDSATARRLRTAFDEAFDGMDFRVVRAAMNDALSGVSGWKSAAIDSARRLMGQTDPGEVVATPAPSIDAGASKVQTALDRPEILELFHEFDQRVDRALVEA